MEEVTTLHLAPSGQFKKELKVLAKRRWDLDRLQAVVDLLQRGQALPDRCRDHALVGRYAGFQECHVGPDWLLVYCVEGEKLILARTGSHADLF
jgi:mRNA interferase YafQ